MAVKAVHVSDLLGKQARQGQLGRLVVLEHPDFAGGPVTLEVRPAAVNRSGALVYQQEPTDPPTGLGPMPLG